MADTAHNVANSASLGQAETKQQSSNMTLLIQQVQLYEKVVASATSQAKISFNTLNLQVNNFNKTQQKTRETAEQTAKKIAEEYSKAADGFWTAAGGALTPAKGINKRSGAAGMASTDAFPRASRVVQGIARVSTLEPAGDTVDLLRKRENSAEEIRNLQRQALETSRQELKAQEDKLNLVRQQLGAIDEQIKLQRRGEAVSLGDWSNVEFRSFKTPAAKTRGNQIPNRSEQLRLRPTGGERVQTLFDSQAARSAAEPLLRSNVPATIPRATTLGLRRDTIAEQLQQQRSSAQDEGRSIQAIIDGLQRHQQENNRMLQAATELLEKTATALIRARRQFQLIDDALRDA